MNAPPDLQDFVAAYLLEAEEHIAVANTQLLALEASGRRGESNAKALRETFRSLHTIKGLSAMVGVEPIVTIAHRLEAFLRSCERSGAGVSLGAIDSLLKGIAQIEQRLTALGRGETVRPPSDEVLAALTALEFAGETGVPTPAPSALDPALRAKLAPFEVEQLERGIAAGQRALLAEFFPSPARSTAGLSINSVRERVARVAEIVRVLPRATPVSAEAPGGLAFVLILLTRATDEAVAEAVGVEPAKLRLVSSGSNVPAAPPPPSAEAPVNGNLGEDDPLEFGMRKGIVRVDVARLDEAMEGLSSLIVTRFRLARAVAGLGELGVNTRELREILSDNARQLRDLRSAIVRVRMVPVADLLERVPLLVRGLRRSTQRLVRLELEGGDAELDKSVSERLFPVIVHLVRNAVDHAIETPDERARRGKPEEGLLRISCSARTNTRLELSVSDDGRGIDAVAVAKKARRPIPESDAELLELLCLPGLSTREVATTTSGRGMGMEIVQRIVVGELGGELMMQTKVGKGTTFTLQVPLTISIVEAFVFESAGQRFVVPVAIVDEVIELESGYGSRVPGEEPGAPKLGLIVRRGQPVPVVELAELLRMSRADTPAPKAIVVRRAGSPIAFGVDRMLGQQEVVIRPMNDALTRAPGVAGATDLGDGRPTLVLDLVALGAGLNTDASQLQVSR